MHKHVTPGWPVSSVGNEPSGCCCLASQSSARLTASSTRRHSSAESTLAGLLSFVTFGCGTGATAAVASRVARRCAKAGDVAHSSTLPTIAFLVKLAAIEWSLSLVNRQQLIWCAEHDDDER